ncbi:MAG: GntR family transcriptional regulator [Terracidiphilus sp.]|jgi:DNA-binding GntR family transcriptional regulator
MEFMKKLAAPQNLTSLAYTSIKNYILREDLDDKARLTEDGLSRQLGISKSPVREALNSLHTEGLIRIEARRGAFVRSFSVQEVMDLYGLREALEMYAVGIAAVTPDLIKALRQSISHTRALLKASDRLGHIEEDMNFHGLIASASGNAELCRRKTYDLSASTAPSAHRAILEALQRGNRKAAQNAMRSHISLVRHRLVDSMQSRRKSQ